VRVHAATVEKDVAAVAEVLMVGNLWRRQIRVPPESPRLQRCEGRGVRFTGLISRLILLAVFELKVD
jgi:hypothetical protein